MNEHKKNQRGITLIALVITVIVLSILAGISVSYLKKNNSIINQSKETKKINDQLQLEKEAQSAYLSYKQQMDSKNDVGYYLNKIGGASVEEIAHNLWYVKKGKFDITVSDKGRIVPGKVELWDGTASDKLEGEGTVEKPFLIKDGKDLAFMSYALTNNTQYTDKLGVDRLYKYACFKQVNDICLNDTEHFDKWDDESFDKSGLNEYTSPGNFYGGYDGDDHIIYGLYINKPTGYYVGLFSEITKISDVNLKITDCYVRNVNIEDGFLVGYNYSGIIAGSLYDCEISNCNVSGKIKHLGGYNVGGITGSNNNGSIRDCKSSVMIESEGYAIGGITGTSSGSCMIENCENSGSIKGRRMMAGIVGRTVFK